MIGRDHGYPTERVDDRQQPSQSQVHRFHGNDGGGVVTGVTDHIAIGVIDPRGSECSGLELLDHLIGDLGRLHPGPLLEGHNIRGNLDVGFQLIAELAAAVAVPEVGHMAVFLGLGDGQLSDTFGGEVLAHGVLDGRWCHQKPLGNQQITVILEHPRVGDPGMTPAVENVEIVLLEGP